MYYTYRNRNLNEIEIEMEIEIEIEMHIEIEIEIEMHIEIYCKSPKCSLLTFVLFSYWNCVVFCCYCGYCCLNFIRVGCSSSSKASYLVSWSECSINQSIFISFLL